MQVVVVGVMDDVFGIAPMPQHLSWQLVWLTRVCLDDSLSFRLAQLCLAKRVIDLLDDMLITCHPECDDKKHPIMDGYR